MQRSFHIFEVFVLIIGPPFSAVYAGLTVNSPVAFHLQSISSLVPSCRWIATKKLCNVWSSRCVRIERLDLNKVTMSCSVAAWFKEMSLAIKYEYKFGNRYLIKPAPQLWSHKEIAESSPGVHRVKQLKNNLISFCDCWENRSKW